MKHYPSVQAKAQKEIDDFMRNKPTDQIPSIVDRPYLPYIDCILKELLRWNPTTPLGNLFSVLYIPIIVL